MTSCRFLFATPATTQLSTPSLHDALPISRLLVRNTRERYSEIDVRRAKCVAFDVADRQSVRPARPLTHSLDPARRGRDRKSTRLNSSHLGISYAVFCLKKKNKRDIIISTY